MTLTIIICAITLVYCLALAKSAAHIAHPGWRRHRKQNRRGRTLVKLLVASKAIK